MFPKPRMNSYGHYDVHSLNTYRGKFSYTFNRNEKKKKFNRNVSTSFSVESRGIWQLPSTLWHSPLPCAPGMLGCLHYWHTGQESGDERGLVEWLSQNTYTSRLVLQHRLAPRKKKNFLALRRQCFARGEAYRVEFLERPWKERESQNKDDRHNHQGKLSTWRRNSLATESHFLVRTERPLAVSELVKL